jgi:glutamine---fructose-6-phosphate transaminase (isomerizing)
MWLCTSIMEQAGSEMGVSLTTTRGRGLHCDKGKVAAEMTGSDSWLIASWCAHPVTSRTRAHRILRVCAGVWTSALIDGLTCCVSFAEREIRSQPDVWQRAVEQSGSAVRLFPAAGSRALLIGCGTSAFVAQSMAWIREQRGHGVTDWAYASEVHPLRSYDNVVAVTRSGTTSEVVQALTTQPLSHATRTVVTADPELLAPNMHNHVVNLSYADELSVIQTRFPTTLLILWRAMLGESVDSAIEHCESTVAMPLPVDPSTFGHFVFLGRGWTLGLAHEAALKMRECAQTWSESHPALDYRHGPISAATGESLVVSMGNVDNDLLDDVRKTGATVLDPPLDPLARLVLCQRLAVAAAEALRLDVDHPRHLRRSVILES